MSLAMLYTLSEWLIIAVFIALLLLIAEGGFRLGHRLRPRVTEAVKSQISSIQAAILALFGLLLAFTMSMAVSRYDARKQLVVEEANAIGTTYLRAQLLPQPHRAEISRLLRDYVDVRLQFFDAGADQERIQQVNDATGRFHRQLWAGATALGELDPRAVTTGLFIQSLNEVIDLPTKRLAALENRVPEVVMLLLFAGAICSLGLIGCSHGLEDQRNLVMSVLFALLISLVILVIIDLDRPRRGLIQVSQQSMSDLQKSLGQFVLEGGEQRQ